MRVEQWCGEALEMRLNPEHVAVSGWRAAGAQAAGPVATAGCSPIPRRTFSGAAGVSTIRTGLALALLAGALVAAAEAAGPDQLAGPASPVAVVTAPSPCRVETTAAVEAWRGDTTYAIGGRIRLADGQPLVSPFPISELEFPMNVQAASLTLSAPLGRRWEAGVRGAATLTADAGAVKDTDWGFASGTSTVDVYSESDGDLNAWEAEAWARYAWPAWGRVQVWLGAGYMRQHLSYDVSNLDQRYPSSGGALDPLVVAGPVATYEATFSAPYAEACVRFALGNRLTASLRATGMPFVSVEDEDHHLLRDKVATADDDGTGYGIEAACRYRSGSGLFVEAGASYRSIDADGRQTQADAGEVIGTIEHRIEQRLAGARLAVGWRL